MKTFNLDLKILKTFNPDSETFNPDFENFQVKFKNFQLEIRQLSSQIWKLSTQNLKTFKLRFENFQVKIKNFQFYICKEVCERARGEGGQLARASYLAGVYAPISKPLDDVLTYLFIFIMHT